MRDAVTSPDGIEIEDEDPSRFNRLLENVVEGFGRGA
jgi:hypothetical protein